MRGNKIDRRKKIVMPGDCLPTDTKPQETNLHAEAAKITGMLIGGFLIGFFETINEICKDHKKA